MTKAASPPTRTPKLTTPRQPVEGRDGFDSSAAVTVGAPDNPLRILPVIAATIAAPALQTKYVDTLGGKAGLTKPSCKGPAKTRARTQPNSPPNSPPNII